MTLFVRVCMCVYEGVCACVCVCLYFGNTSCVLNNDEGRVLGIGRTDTGHPERAINVAFNATPNPFLLNKICLNKTDTGMKRKDCFHRGLFFSKPHRRRICLSVHLSIYLSVYLLVCRCVFLHVASCPSLYLSVCLSVSYAVNIQFECCVVQ